VVVAELAGRWRNPEEDLPTDFEDNRDVHYEKLRQPVEAKDFVTGLHNRMREGLAGLAAGLAAGTTGGVSLGARRGEGWWKVPELGKLPVPKNLEALHAEVARRWGTIDLLDFLKEADHHTGFTDEFTSVATREATPRPVIRKRLLLALHGLGTNIGIKRVATAGAHGETEATLRTTRRLYVNRDNLRRALSRLLEATLTARDPAWWGEGTACASDSKKFGRSDRGGRQDRPRRHRRSGGRALMLTMSGMRFLRCPGARHGRRRARPVRRCRVSSRRSAPRDCTYSSW